MICCNIPQDDWDEIDTMMMALQCDIDLTQQTIRRPSKLKYNATRGKMLLSFNLTEIFLDHECDVVTLKR